MLEIKQVWAVHFSAVDKNEPMAWSEYFFNEGPAREFRRDHEEAYSIEQVMVLTDGVHFFRLDQVNVQ